MYHTCESLLQVALAIAQRAVECKAVTEILPVYLDGFAAFVLKEQVGGSRTVG